MGWPTISSPGFTSSYEFWEKQHQDSSGPVFLEETYKEDELQPPRPLLLVLGLQIIFTVALLNLS